MSRPPIYDFRLGAGWNLPLGSLTNVETITDSSGRTLYPPQSFGSYLPGAPATRLNGLEFERGFSSLEWSWTGSGGKGYVTYGAVRVLQTNFFNGLWSNTLTIYTPTTTAGSYARYNVVATMKKFPESAPNFKIFQGFGIKMTRLTAL